VVADLVFAQQQEMVRRSARRTSRAVEAPVLRDVEFGSDDRLDAGLARRLVKLHGTEQAAVVGERAGRHAILLAALDQLIDLARAVQHAEFGMDV
jgi:hypothetical protein